jgi:hypothetical protein
VSRYKTHNQVRPLEILLKYPTRGRPLQFLQTLAGWLARAANLERIGVLVTADDDDFRTTDRFLQIAEWMHHRVGYRRDANTTKIAACNRGLAEYARPWDVVILVSDDMYCHQEGWDNIVARRMSEHFPDTDGALWFYDGRQTNLNTIECVGRLRWQRFGYLYHPQYASFFCDNESTEVGLRDKKLARLSESICTHEHPCWGSTITKQDDLYLRNDFWWDDDERLFTARKEAGFPLEEIPFSRDRLR